jgi:hypothetical protein
VRFRQVMCEIGQALNTTPCGTAYWTLVETRMTICSPRQLDDLCRSSDVPLDYEEIHDLYYGGPIESRGQHTMYNHGGYTKDA